MSRPVPPGPNPRPSHGSTPAARREPLRYGFSGASIALTSGAGRDHVHAEVELNLIGLHPLQYLFAGGAVAFPVGRWLAYWAAMPHRVLAVPGACTMAWITVPLDTFLGWATPDLAQRILGGAIIVEPQAQPGAGERAEAWTSALREAASAAERHIVALEVEALVRRLALHGQALPQTGRDHLAAAAAPVVPAGTRPRRSRSAPGQSLALVERICRYLAAHYREEIAIADCARAAGVHSHHAMTLFRRTCGTTIHAYLTRLRLAHAQRRLLSSDAAVLAIALEAGFGSQARFYVAFTAAYGTTPAAFRRSHRLLAPPPGAGAW